MTNLWQDFQGFLASQVTFVGTYATCGVGCESGGSVFGVVPQLGEVLLDALPLGGRGGEVLLDALPIFGRGTGTRSLDHCDMVSRSNLRSLG